MITWFRTHRDKIGVGIVVGLVVGFLLWLCWMIFPQNTQGWAAIGGAVWDGILWLFKPVWIPRILVIGAVAAAVYLHQRWRRLDDEHRGEVNELLGRLAEAERQARAAEAANAEQLSASARRRSAVPEANIPEDFEATLPEVRLLGVMLDRGADPISVQQAHRASQVRYEAQAEQIIERLVGAHILRPRDIGGIIVFDFTRAGRDFALRLVPPMRGERL